MARNAIWLSLSFGLFVACTSRQPETTPPQKLMKTQEDRFSITIMEGGGVTGMSNGFTITSDGKVTCWEQMRAGQKTVKWEAISEIEPINKLLSDLENSGLFDSSIEKPGNMSKTVILEKSDSKRTWIWSSPADIPAGANDWYRSINEFCRKLTP